MKKCKVLKYLYKQAGTNFIKKLTVNQNNCVNEISKEFQTEVSARPLRNTARLGGAGVPVPVRSPAAAPGTAARWLGRLRAELKALISDQGGEK